MEHRDWLTRFGFEHLAASLAASLVACGRRIVVLEESETTSGLVGGVIEVLTSLCAGLFGQCWAARRAAKAVVVVTGGPL